MLKPKPRKKVLPEIQIDKERQLINSAQRAARPTNRSYLDMFNVQKGRRRRSRRRVGFLTFAFASGFFLFLIISVLHCDNSSVSG